MTFGRWGGGRGVAGPASLASLALLVGLALLAAMLLGPAGACSRQSEVAQGRGYPYRIVATTGMVADLARAVAREKAQMTQLIGAGVDPHLYRPTRNDVAALQDAHVILYNGLMLEGKLAHVLARLGRGEQVVHAVAECLTPQFLLELPGLAGHYDPHVWMDVSAWRQAVAEMAGALGRFDPANAAYYEANAQRYQTELDRLHEYVRQVIGSIPARQRVLITAHDAFNYFGRAYGLRVLGIQGVSTESEAGLEDLNRLVEFIVQNDVPAVFVETSVADKNVRGLIEGAQARGRTVRIGGTLFSDALGPPGTYEGTYIGMIDHNATVIARALGGTAPRGGMQGRLAGTE